jgi:hypothetical protein
MPSQELLVKPQKNGGFHEKGSIKKPDGYKDGYLIFSSF